MQLSAFLNLIRWKNLLLIAYIQIVIKFLFFPHFTIASNLTNFQFFILLTAIINITAAGYIINDILDIETDRINKPRKVIISMFFTEEIAKKWYLYLNTLGIFLGVSISLKIQKPTLSFIFIGAALLLYYYSKKLKSLPLIGNITVSFLVTINVLILLIFDLNSSIKDHDYNLVFSTILIVSFFAFCINIIRELVKDIEDAQYNQVMINPQFSFNLYNGILLGASFDNKTILDRPFEFEIQPEYGTTSRDLNGAIGLVFNHYRRNSNWFTRRYAMSASMRNYTFDAKFIRFSPSYTAVWRSDNLRENHRKVFSTRLLVLERQDSNFEILEEENRAYRVLNIRYVDSKTELTSRKHLRYDLQLANQFGKLNVEFEYRHMFTDQRLFSFRAFAGTFLYNKTTTDFFSYGLSRPTNYLFDYNLLATSEDSGFLSQQFVLAEGGFKSFMNQNFVNRWLITSNFSYALWRWFEVYGDVGLFETSTQKPTFIYDAGLRVNLVPDYFEVYFPLYANNRLEVTPNYDEKIRFVVTLNLNRLTSLFTRRWF